MLYVVNINITCVLDDKRFEEQVNLHVVCIDHTTIIGFLRKNIVAVIFCRIGLYIVQSSKYKTIFKFVSDEFAYLMSACYV